MKEWNGKFEMVDPRLIVIDHQYQRDEKSDLIAAIAANPTWEAFGAVVLFLRNGVYYCGDGQQRTRGLLASESPPLLVPAIVYDLGAVRREAEIFVIINRFRKALSAWEKHHGLAAAGDPAVLAINRTLEKAGYSLGGAGGTPSPHRIAAIGAVSKIYARGGEEVLLQTLVQAREAYPNDRRALQARFLCTLGEIVEERFRNGGYNRQKLTGALKQTDPGALARKAEQIHFDQGTGSNESLRKAFKALAKV